jgi:hypothetical protein
VVSWTGKPPAAGPPWFWARAVETNGPDNTMTRTIKMDFFNVPPFLFADKSSPANA